MAKKRRDRASIAAQTQRGAAPAKSDEQEEREEFGFWIDEIKRAKKAFTDYFDRIKQINKLYKDERAATADGVSTQHRMNILWSNTQVLMPSTYSRTPQPNVARRFLNKDPVSRTASLIVERNLVTAQELCDFDYPMKRCRDDFLLGARGIVWVRYAPEFAMLPMKEPVTAIKLQGTDRTVYRPVSGGEEIAADRVKDDDEIGQYYETEPVEQVLAYGLDIDHVVNGDFLHEVVNDWTLVGWLARKHMMKRAELVREFGQRGREVVLNKSSTQENEGTLASGKMDCAEVWQVWAKGTRKVIYLTDALPEKLLRKQDDPLRLSTFWPCPRPALGTTTTDSLIPVPDYVLYQDQAAQIDLITQRITVLTKAIRAVGLYNSACVELATLLDEANENQMVPVDNWIKFAQDGGVEGNVDWFPIEQFAKVINLLFTTRAQLRQDLYEVTGISDIIRGVSDPNATATAEQIKSNFGSLRLQDKQGEMSRIARDTLRIMAEIQCEHYPEEALIEMSGVAESEEFDIDQTAPDAAQKTAAAQQKLQAAVALLKSDKMRTFKTDIETDATVAPDQKAEKEARVEFLTAVAPFIEKAAQVGATAPQFVPLLLKLLDYGVRGFRTGRTLEAAIDETIQTAEKMLSESQSGGQPAQDPAQQAAAQAASEELEAKAGKAKEELAQAQAETGRKNAETAAKAAEMQATAAKNAERVMLEIENLKASLANKQADNERNRLLFEKEIQLKQLQINQIANQDGLKEIQGMIGPEQPQVSPEEQEATSAEHKSRLATAQTGLVKAQTEYAQLVKQAQGLGDAQTALEGMPGADVSKIGTPLFGKAKGPMKKLIGFQRDPDTGALVGATVDEIELGDADEVTKPETEAA